MSLSLELCQQLKAAGFPQGEHTTMWIGDTNYCCDFMHAMTNKPYPGSKCSMREMNMVARPNSDELIAQIQAEWPNCVGFHCFTSCWDWWAAFELEVQRKPQEIVELQEGGTPHLAEALARLYIALKEQV